VTPYKRGVAGSKPAAPTREVFTFWWRHCSRLGLSDLCGRVWRSSWLICSGGVGRSGAVMVFGWVCLVGGVLVPGGRAGGGGCVCGWGGLAG